MNFDSIALFFLFLVLYSLFFYKEDKVSELEKLSFSWGGVKKCNRYKVIYFYEMLMVDWDIKTSESDDSDHYTVSSFSEVVNYLERRVSKNHNELWALYKTPGGAHAFLISEKKKVEEGVEIQAEMLGDKCYSRCTKFFGHYNARVEAKKGRKNDFIASFHSLHGTGEANTDLVEQLKVHDQLIKGNKLPF
jgi:hypothetical protein